MMYDCLQHESTNHGSRRFVRIWSVRRDRLGSLGSADISHARSSDAIPCPYENRRNWAGDAALEYDVPDPIAQPL